MGELPDGLRDVFERVDAVALLDILLITIAIYWVLLLVRGTSAWTVLRGGSALLAVTFILGRTFDLEVVNWMLERTVTGLVIGMIVLFQPEIRRGLERLGRTSWRLSQSRVELEQTIELIVRAASRMARQKHGALIVIERETGLQEVIDTGIEIDAELTAELLGSIFMPNTPLHDGAVVVRGQRVVAAGCTLPLTDAPLPAEYGMRHRAALGITEPTDAVVVIVSEERGSVSLATHGRMRPDLDEDRLEQSLRRLLGIADEEGDEEQAAPRPATTASAERRVT